MVSESRSKKKISQRLPIDDNLILKLVRILPAVYLIVLGAFCVTYKVFPGPDFLVLCFLLYAANSKRTKRFIKDWIPFFALFLAYETMRGIADNITGIVHVTELISAELQIFGTIPTLTLQQFFRNPILDWLGAFFYSLHLIIPTGFGFILWSRSSENYRKYTFALLLCSYSALITVLLYPTAPPWFGVNAERILFQIDGKMGVPFYATIFHILQPNPFAAFPSLHAAYPWLISLYAIKIKRIKALPILIIPLGVWFSAVYLGEHYIIDLVAGVAYSTFAFLFVEKIITQLSFRFQYATYFFALKNRLWFDRRDRDKPLNERPRTVQSSKPAKTNYADAFSALIEKNAINLGLIPVTSSSWYFLHNVRIY